MIKLDLALQRLAELHIQSKKRELSHNEIVEMNHCMNINAKYQWELAKLKNLSYVAYEISDFDWLAEVCKQMDELVESSH